MDNDIEIEKSLLDQALSKSFVFTPFQGLGLFPIGAVMNVCDFEKIGCRHEMIRFCN